VLSAAGAAAAVRARRQPRDGRGRAHRLLLLLLLSAQLVQVGQRAHRYRIPRGGCSVCLVYCGTNRAYSARAHVCRTARVVECIVAAAAPRAYERTTTLRAPARCHDVTLSYLRANVSL